MRRKIVAGNWKMNMLLNDATLLLEQVIQNLDEPTIPDVICFVPFPYIHAASTLAQDSSLRIGAQNCAAFVSGAYTGEVSAAMLASCGASAVIIGHSERRNLFAEANTEISMKVVRAIENRLTPVWCCGETIIERKEGDHFSVIQGQIELELSELSPEQFSHLVIAYEPVWAIGTGLSATPEQVQDMHAFIRKTIAGFFGDARAAATRILYGGSCTPANAPALFSLPDVDGGLIGGASLKADDFIKIIEAAN